MKSTRVEERKKIEIGVEREDQRIYDLLIEYHCL